jgi:hypothetical protein
MTATARKLEPPAPAEAETGDAVTLQPLRDSIKELTALHQHAANAREAYADLVDAVADKTKLKPAVIRAFINARLSETGMRSVAKAKQLAMVFEEVGI